MQEIIQKCLTKECRRAATLNCAKGLNCWKISLRHDYVAYFHRFSLILSVYYAFSGVQAQLINVLLPSKDVLLVDTVLPDDMADDSNSFLMLNHQETPCGDHIQTILEESADEIIKSKELPEQEEC